MMMMQYREVMIPLCNWRTSALLKSSAETAYAMAEERASVSCFGKEGEMMGMGADLTENELLPMEHIQ